MCACLFVCVSACGCLCLQWWMEMAPILVIKRRLWRNNGHFCRLWTPTTAKRTLSILEPVPENSRHSTRGQSVTLSIDVQTMQAQWRENVDISDILWPLVGSCRTSVVRRGSDWAQWGHHIPSCHATTRKCVHASRKLWPVWRDQLCPFAGVVLWAVWAEWYGLGPILLRAEWFGDSWLLAGIRNAWTDQIRQGDGLAVGNGPWCLAGRRKKLNLAHKAVVTHQREEGKSSSWEWDGKGLQATCVRKG